MAKSIKKMIQVGGSRVFCGVFRKASKKGFWMAETCVTEAKQNRSSHGERTVGREHRPGP